MCILFVDDDKDIPLVATKFLLKEELTFEFISTTSPFEVLCMLKEKQFDAIVSDDLELFKQIRSENNIIPFILFTRKPREEVAIEALNLGINRYIHKAGDPKSLYAELAHAIKSLIKYQMTKDTLTQVEEKLRLMEEKLRQVCRQRVSSFCRAFYHGMVYPVSKDFKKLSDSKKGRK